jgi:hypothetical protein
MIFIFPLQQWSYKEGELENHDIPGRVLDSKGDDTITACFSL